VLRTRNACADFGEDLLAVVYPAKVGSVTGAFVA
jgi:hypothetical protein